MFVNSDEFQIVAQLSNEIACEATLSARKKVHPLLDEHHGSQVQHRIVAAQQLVLLQGSGEVRRQRPDRSAAPE
jgi:hypothetical protein